MDLKPVTVTQAATAPQRYAYSWGLAIGRLHNGMATFNQFEYELHSREGEQHVTNTSVGHCFWSVHLCQCLTSHYKDADERVPLLPLVVENCIAFLHHVRAARHAPGSRSTSES